MATGRIAVPAEYPGLELIVRSLSGRPPRAHHPSRVIRAASRLGQHPRVLGQPTTGRITWLGHATVLVELDGVRLLTDPVLRPAVAHLRRAVPAPDAPARLDAALVSHLHRDHLDVPSLRRLGELPLLVGPAGAGRSLRQVGPPVRELASGEELTLGALTIRATRAVHDGRRSPVSPPVESLGFLIEGRLRVYFAGDTELFDGMAELAPARCRAAPGGRLGAVARSRAHGRRAGRARGRAAAPGIAVPIHWGTYTPIGLRRGRDRLLRDPPLAFAEHMARARARHARGDPPTGRIARARIAGGGHGAAITRPG